MHTTRHNVYTLTAHVTGFPRVLVTAHVLVYERNATSQLTYVNCIIVSLYIYYI